ncbi:hypothetical protein A3K73_05655 [Candidatus Pacearchaeota archaeon RBG_13_36_9]|nr:MAG: hypothetical protein A3K73_05655 [Candidatus Pacearchaeota archaeon RBG_13_36_9]
MSRLFVKRVYSQNLVLGAGIVFLLSITFILLILPKFNMFAVQYSDAEKILIPEVGAEKEIEYYGYKYSNSSGIIVSALSEIHCSWKSAGEDDSWKECEAVFEIEDSNRVKSRLYSPKVELNFADKINVKNIEISYSQDFEIERETYIQSGAEETAQEVGRGKERKTGLFSASNQGKLKRPVERTLETEKKVFLKDEKLSFKKRKFTDFSDFSESVTENHNLSLSSSTEGVSPPVRGEISEQNLSGSYQESENNGSNLETNNSGSNVSAQKSLESSDNFSEALKNYSENYEEGSQGHNLLSGFSLFSDTELSTEEPFAVRVRFEIPKYSSNQFDFKIYEEGFEASIDPDVSGCGSLDSENGVYLLEEDVEAAQICFIISENNITLDCQGHRITYSFSGEGYGIYSSANFTTIRNCFITDGNFTGNGSAVYLLDSENSLVENNTILTYLDYLEGVYVSGDSNIITNNNITTYGRYAYAVYFTNSFNNSVINNSLRTYYWDSYGIFLDSSSGNQIRWNNATTFEAEAYGIRMYNSSYNLVSYNNITAIEELGYPFYLASDSNYNNLSNNELAVYVKDNAAIYVDSDYNYFKSNNLTSHGNVAFGIHIRPEASNNTFQNNQILTYGDDSYGVYFESGSNNVFLDNIFVTHGYYGFVFLISGSNFNSFFNNSLFTYGLWSPCVLIEGPSNGNLFSGIRAVTNNSFSEIFYAYNYYVNFSVQDSYINASYPATEEVYLESSLTDSVWNFTNVTTFDSRWDIATSGELIVSNYLDIFTNFTNGSYVSADILLSDKNFNEIFSGQTNRNGSLSKILLDYIQNTPDNITGYSNYSLNVSLGWESFSLSLNLSQSHSLFFTFDSGLYQQYNEEVYPRISFMDPTPANETIRNSTSFFVNVTANDSESNISMFMDFDGSLLGWWRMDDIGERGEILDYLGRNNAAAHGNARRSSDGKLGKSFIFEGNGDYINLGNSSILSLEHNFSISFWVKTSDSSGQPTFIGRVDEGGEYVSYWYIGKKTGEGRVEVGLGDGVNYSIFHSIRDVDDNQWHQVIWIRNDGGQEIYIDGINSTYEARFDGPIGDINISTDVYIGGDPESEDYYFNGSIDDLLLFNKSLSREEILGLYANQSLKYIGINFTNLQEKNYLFRAYSQDYGGRVNLTEERFVLINFSYAEANFTNSTNSTPPAPPGGDGGSTPPNCMPLWSCNQWSDCIDGKQTRICTNPDSDCKARPDIERSCKVKDIEKNGKNDTLFDISLQIIKDKIFPNENLSVAMTLINLGIPGKVNANLHYRIVSSSGEMVYEEKEVVPVETQIEFIKTINTYDLEQGNYRLLVDLSYEGQIEPANAQGSFSIGNGFLLGSVQRVFVYILSLFFLTLISLTSYLLLRELKKRRAKF